MKYLDHRHKIRSGDLLAWTHREWGSWYDLQVQAVRFFTQSEYSHVGVAWVIAGRVFVIEAVGAGVRIFPLSRLLPCYWVPLRACWTARAEEYAMAHVGEPYSKLQAVAGFLKLLKPGADHRWQCAELTLSIERAAGVYLGPVATPAAVVQAALETETSLNYLEH
jgi:hypothetical protein